MAKLIKVDGTEQELGMEPSLEQLQGAVGGYIESVHVRKSGHLENEVLIINEEGLRKALPFNEKASLMAMRSIVGDAVLCHETPDGRLL